MTCCPDDMGCPVHGMSCMGRLFGWGCRCFVDLRWLKKGWVKNLFVSVLLYFRAADDGGKELSVCHVSLEFVTGTTMQ